VTCPDAERLTAFVLDDSDDPDLAAHVEACEACQADLLTIQALTGTDSAEREISEALIAKIIAGLPEPGPPPKKDWSRGFHLLLTTVLGLLTALVSVVGTGSTGSVDPRDVLLLSIAFGLFCVLFSIREGKGSFSPDSNPSPRRSP
jgi:hypothetical protein